jgi:hypothetical protein
MDRIQLFAKPQGATGPNYYIELDLYESEPIKITRSIQEIENPQATTSDFSETYRVPHTSSNGEFFKAVFNVNSTDFNATQKCQAYININGAYFMSGNIRLVNVYRNDSIGKIEYDIIFFGQTSTFASEVGPKDLSQLNLNEYAHNASYTNIQNSWLNGLYGGDIVYPLAEWGYTYNTTTKQPNIPTLSIYNPTTGVAGFTISGNGLFPNQFKPVVRAKVIWDKIFQDAGFTYESDFLESDLFRKIYMVSTNDSLARSNNLLESSVTTADQQFALGAFTQVDLGLVIKDNTNGVNVTANSYTAPTTGAYVFDMQFNAAYISEQNALEYNYATVGIYVQVNNTTVYSTTGYLNGFLTNGPVYRILIQNTFSFDLFDPVFNFTLNLNRNDVVKFYVQAFPWEFTTFTLLNTGQIDIEGPAVTDPSGLLPKQYKQLEFIKGINDRFKLMWVPDPQNPNNFFIEPWTSWINGGSQLDWTDKLDEESDITITPLFVTQPREVVFKDSEEADIYNFAYQQTNKETFGQLNQDSGIEVITGKREIKSIFAPVQVAPIGNSNNFLIPHFAKDTETERQPIQVKPRLAFYNGVVQSPVRWYMRDQALNVFTQNYYPLLSNFDTYPFNTTSFDLNWINVPQFWDSAFNIAGPTGATGGTGAVPFSGRTDSSAYNSYWKPWFDSTYDPYARMMKATFKLNSKDFQSLEFNDKIFVKDSWWLPIKVNNFELGQEQKVKVELIKLGNVGVNIDILNPITYYPFVLDYTIANPTGACCGTFGAASVTLYSASFSLDVGIRVYSEPTGSVTAGAGFYAMGGNVYEVNSSGFIITATSCATYPCDAVVSSTSVSRSTEVQVPCCINVGDYTVYFTGPTFYESSALYSNFALTSPVTANRWYGVNGEAVFVGANGFTVTQTANCSVIDCGQALPGLVLSRATTASVACCVRTSGSSGNFGIGTIYTNDTTFPNGDVFYFDPYELSPVGVPVQNFLSNGQTWAAVTGGNKTNSNVCSNPQTNCSTRTVPITFYLANSAAPGGASSTFTVKWEISWDNVNWFYNGQNTYTIANNSQITVNQKYDPFSYIRAVISCSQSDRQINTLAWSVFNGVTTTYFNIPFVDTPSTVTTPGFGPVNGIQGTISFYITITGVIG